jgi:NADPH2:quinone reductase
VYATTSAANADYVRGRGADHVIDYRATDYVRFLQEREPQGLDAVLESLTGEAAVRSAILLARPGGTVVYMNNEPPDMPEIAARRINTKFLHHRPDGESLGRLLQLYAAGRLPLPPVEVLPLEAAAAAHRRSEAGHTRGKLVLAVREM